MVRNLNWIRNIPGFGGRLYEAMKDFDTEVANVAQQVNGNRKGQPLAPPAIGGLKVTGQNGHFSIAIQDSSPIFRGVNYFLEHADNPHFTNPHVIDLGASRNHTFFLGNVTRYFRAYSSYGTSAPGDPAYFGSESSPTPVTGGGSTGGPLFTNSEGSGTSLAGAGLNGPGIAPYRSATGLPPTR